MKMKDLKGKTAVITGAASGIGRGLALALAREGCAMLLSDINGERLDETLQLVKQAGGRAEVFLCDVSKADDVMRLADKGFDALGRVDILINNAGVASAGCTGDIPIKDWEWIVSINFWGVVHGCHAFVPRMKKQGGGHIVNMASFAGIFSCPEMAPYNATKAAVVAVSETLKSELAPYDIGVTVVCPTYIRTNLMESLRYTDDFQRKCATEGMVYARWTPEMLAHLIINAIRKDKLYVVPQLVAKIMWWSKRISPSGFCGFNAFLMRMGWGRELMYKVVKLGF